PRRSTSSSFRSTRCGTRRCAGSSSEDGHHMDRLAAALERARSEGSLARPGTQPLPAPGAARTREVVASAAALAGHHVGRGDQRDAFADVFKHLRTQVLQRMQDAGWQTLGVTSPHAGEGRTTTAINLAMHVALDVDWTAILVDANLEAPGLAVDVDENGRPVDVERNVHRDRKSTRLDSSH